MKHILKACLNWNVLFGIGMAIFFAYLFVPNSASYSWALLALACPLSMMLMTGGMDNSHDKLEKVFVCPECGLEYKDAEWAKKCAMWCKEHHSCNLEIIKHAVEKNINANH
ncbi:MAG: hypothetical protein Q8R30_03135 [bacterium]|nr:hypothetical protein [bacterium]MDZ4285698.1 hypothetical protein [Candidatus Sungbacteria bacterium]